MHCAAGNRPNLKTIFVKIAPFKPQGEPRVTNWTLMVSGTNSSKCHRRTELTSIERDEETFFYEFFDVFIYSHVPIWSLIEKRYLTLALKLCWGHWRCSSLRDVLSLWFLYIFCAWRYGIVGKRIRWWWGFCEFSKHVRHGFFAPVGYPLAWWWHAWRE